MCAYSVKCVCVCGHMTCIVWEFIEKGLHENLEDEVEMTDILFLIIHYLSQDVIIAQRLALIQRLAEEMGHIESGLTYFTWSSRRVVVMTRTISKLFEPRPSFLLRSSSSVGTHYTSTSKITHLKRVCLHWLPLSLEGLEQCL